MTLKVTDNQYGRLAGRQLGFLFCFIAMLYSASMVRCVCHSDSSSIRLYVTDLPWLTLSNLELNEG